MPAVERIKAVKAALLRAAKRYGLAKPSVIVGYNANYAVFVHENTKMKWKGQPRKGKHPSGQKKKGKYWDPQGRGQSKFLEKPARELQSELGDTVAKVTAKTKDLTMGLIVAGQRLQRESQKLVPVDTGNLKGSAFIAVEKSGSLNVIQGKIG